MVNFIDTPSLKKMIAAQGNGTMFIPLDSERIEPSIVGGMASLTFSNQLVTQDLSHRKVKVPVTPSGQIADTVIFNDLNQTSRQYYVPRYRISLETVSGEQRYRIALRPGTSGWELVVYLDAYPAPEIQQQAQNARQLSVNLTVRLTYQWHGEQGDLEFQEVTIEDRGTQVKAILKLHTLEERDDVYLALTDNAYNAALVVQREIKVGVPKRQWTRNRTPTARLNVPSSPILSPNIRLPQPIQIRPILRPNLALKEVEDYAVRGKKFTRYRLEITNWNAFSDDLFAPSPNLPACGLNKNSSRTWVNIHAKNGRRLYGFCAFSKAENLSSLWFAVAKETTPPEEVYVVLNDRLQKKTYTSNTISTKPAPDNTTQFDVVKRVLEQVVDDTFLFPLSLYPYIFRDTQPIPPNSNELIQRDVGWQADGDAQPKSYSYYQNARERHRFNYLPDAFEIGRNPETHGPALSLRFYSADGSLSEESMQAELRYYAAPVIAQNRLEDAAASLKAYLPQPLPPGVDGLEFLPLRVGHVKFYLSLPNAEGGMDLAWEREAQVSLQEGIFDTITLPMAEFWEIWQAIFSTRRENTLFTGRVEVTVIEGQSADVIPFEIRSDSDQQTLLENILEPDTLQQFVQPVTVKVLQTLFSGTENNIEAILVSFERGDTLTFTQSILAQTANVRMPLRDPLKLLEDSFGESKYRYRVQVIRKDGSIKEIPADIEQWIDNFRTEFYLDIDR
ncbi:MAG: hypothetical protein AAGD25_24480 [Cyanobacteria bacterium P01_F01_bin.150]